MRKRVLFPMNCPTCHTPAKHVAGQVHWCEACQRNLLDRGDHTDAMECRTCGDWMRSGTRPGYGLCLNKHSRKDETTAGDTCGWWMMA